MSISTKTLVLASVTIFDVACLIGVAALGGRALSLEPVRADGVRAGSEEVRLVDIGRECKATRERPQGGAATGLRTHAEGDAVSKPAAAPQRESEFMAAFRESAAREPQRFADCVRRALAEDGPDCRKVAALRVLCERTRPETDEILVAAILELPDVSKPAGESVPRYALGLLAERAQVVSARNTLGELLWTRGAASALRATAAVTLAAACPDDELPEFARRLRGESDALVLAGAVEALSRRPLGRARQSALETLGRDELVVARGSAPDGQVEDQ